MIYKIRLTILKILIAGVVVRVSDNKEVVRIIDLPAV